jgi:hypothetical protein
LQDGPFSQLNPTYAAVIALFAVLLWCGVCILMSAVGGWLSLVRRFRKMSKPFEPAMTAGPFFYAVFTRMWCLYCCVIRITAAGDGIYLSVLFPFRFGHPPLRVPWSEVRLERSASLLGSRIVLTLGGNEQVPMSISERMADNLGILERIPD